MLEWVRIQKHFPLRVFRAQLPGRGAAFRAVHLSDLHLEDGFDAAWLRDLVRRVNAERPDVVFFTGDFTCKEPVFYTAPSACAILRGIEAPVLAVEGNHDLTGSAGNAAELMRRAGFYLLKYNDFTFDFENGSIQVIGLGSLYRPGAKYRKLPKPDYTRYRVCLIHEPEWASILPAGYADVIFAGHTHGGQISIPVAQRLWMPSHWGGYHCGEYRARAGLLFVSAGLGESGPHLRVRAPREYGVFTWKES